MSDIDDDYDDDFDLSEYFYVEDTYDEVGDLAEHAIASPVSFDDVEDYEWDRFAYWNDIEYDSDGYHDVHEGRPGRKKQAIASTPRKRKSKGSAVSPSKKRKLKDGTAHVPENGTDAPLLSPVAWRPERVTGTPTRDTFPNSFALLKNWREQFPDSETTSETDEHGTTDAPTLEIDPLALQAALRANLGSLVGGAGTGDLGLDESMLLEHITRMLSAEGATADDIAGSLADALLARDDGEEDESMAGTEDQDTDGDIVGVVPEPSPPAETASEPKGKQKHSAVPAFRRPPTPTSSSTSTGSHSTPHSLKRKHADDDELGLERKDSLLGAPDVAPDIAPDVGPILSAASGVLPRGRKRKQPPEKQDESGYVDGEVVEGEPMSKRVASTKWSFDRPTASSKAKSAAAGSLPSYAKGRAKKAGK
ncbi:hypothetical protein NA57DRAFT_70677 [Rhizodiscina lignyota]|uniref:Uncharacterized protein n=1 Tax=Rhizodiscina lignyota TaxID=1504668 RepID=A0A9P4MAW3_9PEZI|nr:hypothetical protein NA57DRAFT_70677 [Rhizodiscina lignyota]